MNGEREGTGRADGRRLDAGRGRMAQLAAQQEEGADFGQICSRFLAMAEDLFSGLESMHVYAGCRARRAVFGSQLLDARQVACGRRPSSARRLIQIFDSPPNRCARYRFARVERAKKTGPRLVSCLTASFKASQCLGDDMISLRTLAVGTQATQNGRSYLPSSGRDITARARQHQRPVEGLRFDPERVQFSKHRSAIPSDVRH